MEMENLIKQCVEDENGVSPIAPERLRFDIDDAKKNLINFQYKTVRNSTATAILPNAHNENSQNTNQVL